MSVSKEDLRDFNRFANERLENGAADSLVSLANEWESQCRIEKQSVASQLPINLDIDEQTLRELAAAFPEIDDKEVLRRANPSRGGVTTAQMLAKAAALAEKASQK